ncbi:unnamed protein product [Adineta steineri]|uniref:PX domain-containing protein n=1 Tax=Adineta steineri TaxID=433720 RepID=A0A820FZY1_9BILA|nr:unnamed protein product [Adineta steineri]
MNTTNPSDGINGFVQSHLLLILENIIERHMQYLPYPNENFHDKCEDISIDQEDNQYPLQQIYLRSNKIFLSHHPVEVVNIEAERIYNPIGEFLNPYLYTITIRYGSIYEWTIKRRYKHFHELHQSLLHYIKSEFKKSRHDSNKHDENNDENHKLIQQQQPRFPTQNDRIAFINEFSIRDRCV